MQWEDPPEKRKRTGKWEAIFAELRANPMKWAKLSEGKDRNSHSLAGRLRTDYGREEFEIISQTTEPVDGVKQAGVWARYVPPEPDPGELVTVPENRKDESNEVSDYTES